MGALRVQRKKRFRGWFSNGPPRAPPRYVGLRDAVSLAVLARVQSSSSGIEIMPPPLPQDPDLGAVAPSRDFWEPANGTTPTDFLGSEFGSWLQSCGRSSQILPPARPLGKKLPPQQGGAKCGPRAALFQPVWSAPATHRGRPRQRVGQRELVGLQICCLKSIRRFWRNPRGSSPAEDLVVSGARWAPEPTAWCRVRQLLSLGARSAEQTGTSAGLPFASLPLSEKDLPHACRVSGA